jgi:hypothetical protein
MFKATHVVIQRNAAGGTSSSHVEAVPQDGTAPWFELYCETDDQPLFTWGADGKVRLPHSGRVIEGARAERVR